MPIWTDFEQFKDQLYAVCWNVYDWLAVGVLGGKGQSEQEVAAIVSPARSGHGSKSGYCVLINRPGSIHQIVHRKLEADECTVGYNLVGFTRKNNPIVQIQHADLPDDAVLLRTQYFSVNYADVCIRWGLYDSANKYVGWPICPGFDVSGEIEWAGKSSGFEAGDKVFGCTFFGGYSSRVLVPAQQLRKVPRSIASLEDAMNRAAAIPAVACTALHALNLAGFWPNAPPLVNKSVLVHSAAGGVGTMLCCLAKHLGATPVVGVVGREEKIKDLKALRTTGPSGEGSIPAVDYAVLKKDLWTGSSSPAEGKKTGEPSDAVNSMEFAAIFDANGVETLQRSYDSLAQAGRLIIYGFHTNLPRAAPGAGGRGTAASSAGALMLSPLSWLRIVWSLFFGGMPRFDPMLLTVTSKAVMGFNLSFFTKEVRMMAAYFDAILGYIEGGVIPSRFPVAVVDDVREGHELLCTGNSVGKIVVRV